ncbi:hypothetical protein HYPGJ_31467 [Hyphomicrobium sp. GJ21]|nr:hypothetical protein HYPGJ_31467 [Hyphomicrobium sp. GJ21]
MLAAEFGGGALSEAAHRFLKLGEGCHFAAEGPGGDDLLVGGVHLDQVMAGDSPKLQHHPLHHHTEMLADEFRLGVPKRKRGLNAKRAQAPVEPAGNAPEVGEVEGFEGLGLILSRHQAAHAVPLRVLLGGAVRHFRQRLGGGDADGHRNAGPLDDLFAHGGGVGNEALLEAFEREKGLVDGVDLKVGREGLEHRHHAGGEVAVERIVGGAGDDTLLAFAEVPGFTHLDAKGFRFVAARYHAAVVVTEDDQSDLLQFWLKQPFAAGVEIVAVNKGDGVGHANIRMLFLMTPQTWNSQSSVSGIRL